MPFQDDLPVSGPLAIPEGHALLRTPESTDTGVFGAAMRLENPISSKLNSFQYNDGSPLDPSYRPFDDIQGTVYEQYAERFVDARNADQAGKMKAQIDREIDDRKAIDAAGGWGFMAEMTAGLLSPTSLLPGGAIVRGATGGVRIGKTAMSVALAGGAAVALDEFALQQSQELRTGEESTFAIGGGILLGGLLGGSVGALSKHAYRSNAASAELIPQDLSEFDDKLRSVGAAENSKDLAVRREELFQFFNKSQFRLEDSLSKIMPRKVASVVASPAAILRPVVRSDPILRAMLSDNIAARRGLADLVETPLQYKVNEQGQTVTMGGVPVETAIKTRRNTELSMSLGFLNKSFAEYMNDGPVGKVASVTAPVTGTAKRLLGQSEKMSRKEFLEEIGVAAMSADAHPVPQVQKAAQMIRKEIFEKARMDAIAVGLFDESLQLKNADSYFMRVYNVEKIEHHLNDGTDMDIAVALREQFVRNKQEAITRLENDDTLERAQDQLFKAREALTQTRRALRQATKKAQGKRDRAKAAIKTEGRVQRVTGALRKHFEARAKKLREGLLDGDDLQEFKQLVKDVRGVDRIEPPSLLSMIRALGGIKDPRVKNTWRNGDWANDGLRTDIEEIMDTKAVSIRRNEGREIDTMREALEEAGYLPEGATINDLLDAIRKEADGQKVYSQDDAYEVARYEATKKLAQEMDDAGIDVSQPFEKIIQSLEGKAKSQKVTKAKANEAARSGKKAAQAGSRKGADLTAIERAMDRLEDANARLKEIKDDIGPKAKEDMKALRVQIADDLDAVRKAKEARTSDEFYADKSDSEITFDIQNAIQSIIGMKTGSHSIEATLSSPTKARTLDVHDSVLMPWLEKDMSIVVAQYFNSIVPDIEVARKYGDVSKLTLPSTVFDEISKKAAQVADPEKKQAILAERDSMVENLKAVRMDDKLKSGSAGFDAATESILAEGYRMAWEAKAPHEKLRHLEEAKERAMEHKAMHDRLTGRFGIPDNPKDVWTRGSRLARTASYMGYLGGMTISAIPDVAGVVGRNGIEAAFGATTALTDPKRMGLAINDALELGSGAEWYLNSRAMMIADIADQYGSNSALERSAGAAATLFGKATGMVAWNAGWKTIGGAVASSRMAKAAMAVKNGTVTRDQLLALSANGIETPMAQKIAAQIEKHGDMDGDLWLAQGRKWDDPDAYQAFQNAMNREMDIMIVTPGQDKPLSFSTPTGAFFFQFKSFGVAAQHRILLSGMQRADGAVLAQVTMAILLGGLVSNIKAMQNGNEPKEGAAFWEDAIDRSGLAGWLTEAYGMTNALTDGALSISGEKTSRFRSRSELEGLMGPSVDLLMGLGEGLSAYSRGSVSENDARQLLRPLPGNNLPYFMGLTKQAAGALSEGLSE